ncbi:MAG: hypothetical protein ACLQJR_09600 [Stellaceae bacterium]
MTRHSYSRNALLADYTRAALGLALTVSPLLLVRMLPLVALVFAALAALFAVFAAATLARQLGTVSLDDTGIAVDGPWHRRIDWRALDRLRLRWYAPRRDRSGGFMQLVLSGGGRRIALDSRIDGFETIAAAASRAAEARGIALGEATLANLAALGIVVSRQSSVVSN